MSSPLTLHPCSPPDIPRLFAIMSLAFGHSTPYVDAILPAHDTPAGRAHGTSTLLHQFHHDPTATFIKAVNAAGAIVGMSVWQIPTGKVVVEELTGDAWASEDEREYANLLFRQMNVPRGRVVQEVLGRGGRLHVLHILAVDPAFQKCGAGGALVRWGTERADEAGAEALVESTPVAKRLYEKYGFRLVEQIAFEIPDKFAHKPKPIEYFLRRPASEKAVGGG